MHAICSHDSAADKAAEDLASNPLREMLQENPTSICPYLYNYMIHTLSLLLELFARF